MLRQHTDQNIVNKSIECGGGRIRQETEKLGKVVNGEFIKFFERNFNPAALVVPAAMRQAIACQMLHVRCSMSDVAAQSTKNKQVLAGSFTRDDIISIQYLS